MGAGCCDNLAFGKPCGDCGADHAGGAYWAPRASRSRGGGGSACTMRAEPLGRIGSPALQALNFGATSADSNPGMPSFWRTATAAHIYRTGESRSMIADNFLDKALQQGQMEGMTLIVPGPVDRDVGLDPVPKPPVVVTPELDTAAAKILWGKFLGLFGSDEDVQPELPQPEPTHADTAGGDSAAAA